MLGGVVPWRPPDALSAGPPPEDDGGRGHSKSARISPCGTHQARRQHIMQVSQDMLEEDVTLNVYTWHGEQETNNAKRL